MPGTGLIACTESWDGWHWTLLGTPPGSMAGVSCPTAGFCVALGDLGTGASPAPGYGLPFAVRWDGSAWTRCPRPEAGPGARAPDAGG